MTTNVRYNPFTGDLDIVDVGSGPGGDLSVQTDSGTATSVAMLLKMFGAGGASTSATGDTVTVTSAPAVTWETITANQTLDVNTGYFCSSGTLSLALPAASAVGDIITIIMNGATSVVLTQSAGQSIRIGGSISTVGALGSMTGAVTGNAVTLVCSVANLTWVAESVIGTFTPA